MRRKSIRSGRSDRRPGCVSSQRNKGSARASSRLRRQRPSWPGAVTSACKPACSRPRRSDASVAGPRARFAHEARWPAMFPARCSPRRRVSSARARSAPGQRRLDQRQPAQRGQRQQGAAGQHAALARRQSELIIPGARAPVRDALAPCRERRRRQGPEREAHERLAGAAPCGGARRRRQPPACGSTDTPSLAAALIQSGVPLPAPGHGARRAPSPHPTRRPHSASRPLRRWRRPDAAWPRPTGTRTPIARDRLATAGGPGARDRSRGPGRGTPVAHGHARARAVRRRRVRRHACNCRPPIHTVAAMAAHLMAPRHDPATALARRASATFQPGATSAPASISRPCSAGMSWGHQGGIPPIQTIRAGLAVSSARKRACTPGMSAPDAPTPGLSAPAACPPTESMAPVSARETSPEGTSARAIAWIST